MSTSELLRFHLVGKHDQATHGKGGKGGQISLEAQPSTGLDVIHGLQEASFETKQEYMHDILGAMHDKNGNDIMLEAAGIHGAESFEVVGVWQGNVSPGFQVKIPKGTPQEAVDLYAAAAGKVLKQDAVGYHRPTHEADQSKHNSAEVLLGKTITPKDSVKLYNEMKKEFGGDVDGVALVASSEGVRALNFTDTPNAEFHQKLDAAQARAFGKDNAVKTFASDGGLIENDWDKNPKGEAYDLGIQKGRPDFQRRVDGVQRRVDKVNKQWRKKLEAQAEVGDLDKAAGERSEEVGSPWPGSYRFHLIGRHDQSTHGTGRKGPGGGGRFGGKDVGTSCPSPCKTTDPFTQGGSRVGVDPGGIPDRIGRMPGLTKDERAAENRFASEYENDPGAMSSRYRERVAAKSDGGNTFNTDDAKELSGDYNSDHIESKGIYNVAVHQTANAVAKRAFADHLEANKNLPDDQKLIVVTSGGVAAGKGFAISASPEVQAQTKKATAVWDAAGEQNATENEWVLGEARKNGYKVVYAYVHADPVTAWAGTEDKFSADGSLESKGRGGAVTRAMGKGRMVNEQLFAESYELSARNFDNFQKAHKSEKDVAFAFFDNDTGGLPKPVKSMPKNALKTKAAKTQRAAAEYIDKAVKDKKIPTWVHSAGTNDRRLWAGESAPEPKTPSPPSGFAEAVGEVGTDDVFEKSAEEITGWMTANLAYWSQNVDEYDKKEVERLKDIEPVTPKHAPVKIGPDGNRVVKKSASEALRDF